MRLDLFLFNNNYVKSRQKGKDLILSDNVMLNGAIVNKPSYEIDEEAENVIEIFDDCPYVSRGALKLEKLIERSKATIDKRICLDIGASTGGFTQVLLNKGASKIYAVDSGREQLDASLKSDTRVVSIEGYNARCINIDDIGEEVDIITIDVSFISQTLILPSAVKILNSCGEVFSLIKPQFEAGKENIGKGGIVKNTSARHFAVNRVISCMRALGYLCDTFIKSPILGGDGNVEYLAHFSKKGNELAEEYIKNIVFNS